jgi:hypothetical protein
MPSYDEVQGRRSVRRCIIFWVSLNAVLYTIAILKTTGVI